ncbi:MAG: hypothetical protein KDB61_15465, partial [Planctomycetes bacterium]|nr:hypothetical protein [Planctomycetota bacterium]
TGQGWALEQFLSLSDCPGPQHDLGVLELGPTGSLHGRLLLPEGLSPGGLCLYLDTPRSSQKARVAANGRFELSGLTPGPHRLLLAHRQELSAGLPPLEFTIAPRDVTRIEWDVRLYSQCDVTLQLERHGSPWAGCEVRLIPEAPRSGGNPTDWEGANIGTTDENGTVYARVPAAGWAQVEAVANTQGSSALVAPVRVHLSCEPKSTAIIQF